MKLALDPETEQAAPLRSRNRRLPRFLESPGKAYGEHRHIVSIFYLIDFPRQPLRRPAAPVRATKPVSLEIDFAPT